jgi:hypothetical protein
METSIYHLLAEATDADTAYYLAPSTHRRRTAVLECQIHAAVSDAIVQFRNGRVEFARTLADIIESLPMSDGVRRCTDADRALLAEIN